MTGSGLRLNFPSFFLQDCRFYIKEIEGDKKK